ncbi:S1 RNA-binding domain-containing protein [Microaerobacter geothermalis]|uniref:S1 RNA-binding domain-containing protein n=1 Tax=Microaerobacter geothermalis TaxID=674972 RepID=UPI001F1AD5E5|nr:S1 RNA-binding domain-containing protein [Microaerobacter geothermalis]MCF6094525.1 S1 RNA-binding domain-containing protein [Microaerobacter geothermalis]
MSDQMLQILIEGFQDEKLEENKYDEHWQKIYSAYQNNSILQAHLVGIETKLNKPCGVVQIGHIRGYIPLEYSGADNIQELRKLTGELVAFKIINYDRDGEVFTASRTAALEHMANVTWKRIKEGQTIIAVAREVDFSEVKADIGGIQVKIPINEIDYGWIDDLTEKVKPGDHLRVKVLEVNEQEKKVKVSAKATKKNPWPDCTRRYHVHSEYVGKISGVEEYGNFVNLEPGVDALAPHLRWEKFKKGDRVLVRILKIDVKKEQIRVRIVKKV